MKIQSVFLAFFLTVLSTKTFANPVQVAQWIPWNFANSMASHFDFSSQFESEKMIFNWQDWQPSGSGISLSIHPSKDSAKDIQSAFDLNGLQIQAQNFSADLKIQQLQIDQTVIRNFNGNQVSIRLQATCQPFQIHVPAFSFHLNLPFEKQAEYWAPHLTETQLSIPAQSWTVSPIVCAGPLGMDLKVAETIQSSLQNTEALKNLIQSQIAPLIDGKAKQLWESLLASDPSTLKIVKMSNPSANGFFLLGEINLQSSGAPIGLPDLPTLKLSLQTPQLVLSQTGFESMVTGGIQKMSLLQTSLNQISGFQKLLSSRFLQFFLWPDLMNFSKKAAFTLNSTGEPKVHLKSASPGVWNLQMQTLGTVQADRAGKTQHYLDWGVGLGAQLKARITDSQLHFDLLSPKTNIRWNFAADYVKQFEPDGSISTTVLDQATQFLVTQKGSDVVLPTLKIQNQTWKLNGFQTEQNMMIVNWTTKSQP